MLVFALCYIPAILTIYLVVCAMDATINLFAPA